ncbi:MAG TPA: hypothetical protein ENI83_01045 [Gammaproteobacteria bacterium]|nr:hypothetical protein [Gammaproteobacteria bacterium]
MQFIEKKIPVLLTALVLAAPGAGYSGGRVEIAASYDYSSGDYGQDVTTEIEYMPVSLAYTDGPWRVELTVPYIRVTGNGTVVPGSGSPLVFDNFSGGLFGSGGGSGGGSSSTASVSNSGLGDVITRVGYAFMPADGSFYELSGKVKFGTADENDGLGTGENDYAVQFDGVLGSGVVSPYFTVGYLVTGDSGDFTYRDVPYGSLGLMFKTGEGSSAGLGYDYRRATVSGSDDQHMASAFLGWKLTPGVSASVSAIAGFTDSTPDYGASVKLTNRF